MSDTNISPNMGLPIPIASQDPGPDFAFNINACLLRVDSHNHSSGQGVPIGPSGLNINSDLTFQSNNATNLRSTRYIAQGSPLSAASDYLSLSVSGVDLYYLDGNGNAIQITKSGGVAGSPGSIGSLTSPASATYVAGTPAFVFQSDVNTPASIDGGSYIFRNILANSKGVTLSPPNSLAADYAMTWFSALPAAQSFLTIDNAGSFSAPIAYANGITRANLAAVGQQISSSSSSFGSTSNTPVDVTNLSAVLTTTGRPVQLRLQPAGATASILGISAISGTNTECKGSVFLLRKLGSGAFSTIATWRLESSFASTASGVGIQIPCGSIAFLDAPSAGTYTYKIQVEVDISNSEIFVQNISLAAYEL